MSDDQSTEPALSDKAMEALGSTLRVEFKTKNYQLLYSIMNRPDPIDVSDAMLVASILHAGTHFKVTKVSRLPAAQRESVQRSDGRQVTYKEAIEIDWTKETIRSTKGRNLTLQVLSIVVKDLSEAVARKKEKTSHGAN